MNILNTRWRTRRYPSNRKPPPQKKIGKKFVWLKMSTNFFQPFGQLWLTYIQISIFIWAKSCIIYILDVEIARRRNIFLFRTSKRIPKLWTEYLEYSTHFGEHSARISCNSEVSFVCGLVLIRTGQSCVNETEVFEN